MKHYVIAVRDIVADVYNTPMFVHNIGGAIRGFGDACTQEGKENIQLHPEDFELYELGEYDDGTATFTLHAKPKQIAVGANYRKQ